MLEKNIVPAPKKLKCGYGYQEQCATWNLGYIIVKQGKVIFDMLQHIHHQNKVCIRDGGAFAAATILGFVTWNAGALALGYFVAFLVAQSRIEAEIHTVPQVVVGALLVLGGCQNRSSGPTQPVVRSAAETAPADLQLTCASEAATRLGVQNALPVSSAARRDYFRAS